MAPPSGAFFVNSAGDIVNEHLYTGRRTDPETGLQLNRYRFYHQQLGRWVTRDPIGYDAGSNNLYEYVGGMPTYYVDPSGLRINCANVGGSAGGGIVGSITISVCKDDCGNEATVFCFGAGGGAGVGGGITGGVYKGCLKEGWSDQFSGNGTVGVVTGGVTVTGNGEILGGELGLGAGGGATGCVQNCYTVMKPKPPTPPPGWVPHPDGGFVTPYPDGSLPSWPSDAPRF
ncbi:RHS repeat-associated core domain-containing protein [Posidoniimonas polymericola]|uniref:RHS repeat-associated core domain-containing protein n=1 Tax=Posidoniimonas polymericola TaxID=2528002 RepID=UPI0011B5EF05